MLKDEHFKQITCRSLLLILFELKKLNSETKLTHKDWEEMQSDLYCNLPTSKDIDRQREFSREIKEEAE